MTDQERLDKFKEDFTALQEKYGVTFIAILSSRMLSDDQGGREQRNIALIQPAFIGGWVEPEKPKDGTA